MTLLWTHADGGIQVWAIANESEPNPSPHADGHKCPQLPPARDPTTATALPAS